MIDPSDMKRIREAEIVLSGAVLFYDRPESLAATLPEMVAARDGLRKIIEDGKSNVAPGKQSELRDALDRAHLVFGAESDARKRDFEAAWLEGAREMYLDVQKAFPLTAPAGTYAEQLLARIRKPLT